MSFLDCLAVERTKIGVNATSKKRVFELLSDLLATRCTCSSEQQILESLFARERIGCTGIGLGIAIPHGRIAECDETVCAVIMTEQPIDYQSPDNQPVDIFFAMLVPEDAHNQHLRCLSTAASMLKEESFCRQLRNAYSDQALFDIISAAASKLEAETSV
ncbi:MAG: PTS sugar transporter subunit IIA [Kangiellaceae bacterium]|jgi:PTS system nitrogen regulatory IIA component|nr:PTS sugar transporter subunit IIA [Kangiellaceae bacterium]